MYFGLCLRRPIFWPSTPAPFSFSRSPLSDLTFLHDAQTRREGKKGGKEEKPSNNNGHGESFSP